jgi:hypothetical protein
MTTAEQLKAVLSENDEIKTNNVRLRRCMQHLIDNGYTAGTGSQTPDELCDDLLPDEWPSCLPLPPLPNV